MNINTPRPADSYRGARRNAARTAGPVSFHTKTPRRVSAIEYWRNEAKTYGTEHRRVKLLLPPGAQP